MRGLDTLIQTVQATSRLLREETTLSLVRTSRIIPLPLLHLFCASSHRLTFTVIGRTPFSQDSLGRRLFASEELHKIKYYPHGKKPSSPPCEPVMNAREQLLSHKWHDKCLALGKSLL